MMADQRRVAYAVLVVGIASIVVAVLTLACFFYEDSLRKLPFSNVPLSEFYIRVGILIAMLVFALAVLQIMLARDRATAKLRASERFLIDMFDGIQEGITLLDRDLTVQRANVWMERMYADRELTGRKCYEVYQGRDTVCPWCPAVKTLATGEAHTAVVPYPTEESPTGWIELSAYPVTDDAGEITGVIEHVRDITEYKHIQHELERTRDIAQEYLDVAGVMFVVLDNEGRVILLNLKACEVLGCSEDEALGSDWFDNFLPVESREATRDVFHSLMRGEAGPAEYYENLVVTASGEERVIAWRNTTLTDEDGKPTGTLSSGEDITERRTAQEALRLLNEELEQRVAERTSELMAVNHELESFAYSVSHDLRAPLRSVDGFSAALIEDYGETLDDVAKDYVQRMRVGAQHMGQLIDDLLTLSRVTQFEMSRETVDLSALVKQINAEERERAPGRDVTFIAEPGVTVEGDRRLLRVLLTNLLDNAWKFTGKHPTATIEFGTTEIDGETTCYVRDNGAGFDMQYVHKLFGPFQRLHRVDEFPGTGIGLATVQRIINRHGGRVWAEGEVDKGAAIYFTLQRGRTRGDETDD